MHKQQRSEDPFYVLLQTIQSKLKILQAKLQIAHAENKEL